MTELPPFSGQLPTRPHCPHCDNPADGWNDIAETGATPKGGDASICIGCGELSIYTDALGLRKPTASETLELHASPEIQAARLAWEQFIFDFGAWNSAEGRVCPKHGVIHTGPAFTVQIGTDFPRLTRRYCPLCILEALDSLCPHELQDPLPEGIVLDVSR